MPEYIPDPYDVPNGLWESVFLTRPGGTPYKDGHYANQCKVCHGEWPDHKPDCEYYALYIENAQLRSRLARLESDRVVDDLGGF